MILRRLKAHVEKENWFAVFLDFAIVVTGVFIGIQLGNWNDARSDRAALSVALSNLDLETQTNLDIIDQMVAKVDATMLTVGEGRDILLTCSADSEDAQTLATAIGQMSGDFEPTFVTSALDILADQERFVGGLSPDSRRAFYQYQSRLKEEQDQLRTNFDLLWRDHIIFHPLMDGDMSVAIESIFGPDPKPTIVVSSVDAACQSPTFRRQYQLTTSFVFVIAVRLKNLRTDIEAFRLVLDAERGGG